MRGDEKPRGDVFLAKALIFQGLERAELVERMQRLPLNVLGEAVLFENAVLADDAGDRRGFIEALLLNQQFQRPVAAATSLHLVSVHGLAILAEHGPHTQAL